MKYFLLMAYSLMATYAMAQDYNKSPGFIKANSVWIFGNNAGYNFNTRTAIRQPMNSEEGCASVSDPNTGELIFYSDGARCWNRNRILMSETYSTALLGNNKNNGTTAQGVCIVPFINDSSKYYLFSLEAQGGYGASVNSTPYSEGKLYYSVVDMSLNNGLGNIDPSQKNILVDSFLGEMMIAIPGDNCDVWLMVHTIDSGVFKAYHITEEGVDLQPVISRTGNEISGYSIYKDGSADYKRGAYMVGNTAVSPDRTMLAITSRITPSGTLISRNGMDVGALVCKFDAGTGIVSDAILLDSIGCYGAAFSPDNSKLYITTNDPGLGANIYQWEVDSFDAAVITASKTDVKRLANTVHGLKLYNDTIYIAGAHQSPLLHRINQPNLKGVACNVQDSAIYLAAATTSRFMLPNDVVFALPPDVSYNLTLDTTICVPAGLFPAIDISAPAGWPTFTWQDGSVEQNRTITEPGIYWVESTDGCHFRTDTFNLKQIDFTKPQISVNINELATVLPYYSYQWLLAGEEIAGATQRYYDVTANGKYQVITSNGKGCMDTSDIYEVNNYTSIADVGDQAKQIKVYPNPATDYVGVKTAVPVDLYLYSIEGKNVNRAAKANQISLQGLSNGIYFLHINDQSGRTLKVEKIVKQ